MAKTSGHEELGTVLPEELRNLISRKLELRRREQLQVYMAANQFARLKMRNDMMTEMGAKRLGEALISIPLSAFREKVDRATAITRSWPGIVWECITSVLNKAKLTSCEADELHGIVDELAWAKEQRPFTYAYIAPDKLMDSFYRDVSRYGIQPGEAKTEMNRQLKLTAAVAEAGILNTARWAREEISIAIEEYVIALKANKANLVEASIVGNNNAFYATADAPRPVSAVFDQCETFRQMKNLTSDQLSIAFVGDKTESGLAPNNMLEISARNESKRVSPGELDLVDRRTGAVNSQGFVLLGMARKIPVPVTPANAKKISRLREMMREKLGVKDDLFDRLFNSAWTPRFQITDKRGLADERAKTEAQRRTVSIDQQNSFSTQSIEVDDSNYPFESESDDADDWLKKNT
jgi:hypothetical protein